MLGIERAIAMTTSTIRWDVTGGDPPHTTYFIDDISVGEDDQGVDQILEFIRSNKYVQVALKIQGSSLGGGDLTDSLPFADRIDDLQKALGARKITYEFG